MTNRDDHPQEDEKLPISLSDDPKLSAEARAELHGSCLAGMVYANQLNSSMRQSAGSVWPDVQATAVPHAKSVIDEMKCRDPLEEMLVQQALWTHARVAQLTMLAQSQTDIHSIRILNESCNRASNTYRRLLLALSEKRRPRRSRQFTAIKQANMAAQQIVQSNSAGLNEEKTSNELGYNDAKPNETTIPIDRRRPYFAQTVDSQDQAMDEVNRAAER